MAKQTVNGPKPNSGEITQILKFAKELLPNKFVRALQILLHPCCEIATTTTVSCGTGGVTVHDLSIAIDNPIAGVGTVGLYLVSAGGMTVFMQGTVSADGATITVNDATIPAETYTLYTTLLYHTAVDGSSGVYRLTTEAGIVITDCA